MNSATTAQRTTLLRTHFVIARLRALSQGPLGGFTRFFEIQSGGHSRSRPGVSCIYSILPKRCVASACTLGRSTCAPWRLFLSILCRFLPHAAQGFSSTHNVIYTRPPTQMAQGRLGPQTHTVRRRLHQALLHTWLRTAQGPDKQQVFSGGTTASKGIRAFCAPRFHCSARARTLRALWSIRLVTNTCLSFATAADNEWT